MGPYELHVAAAADRTLSRLPERYAASVAEFITSRLLTNPRRFGKPMRYELEGYLCARVGALRVIYWVLESEHTVFVERIDHRADIYRVR